MNILLINPINRSYIISPSLGLGYLASLARQAGHSVTVLHCVKERMSYSGWDRFLKNNAFDLIGFQVYSYDLDSVKRHIDLVKIHAPDAVTVAGGAHPSGDPKGAMKYLEHLDYAFQGEAELGFPQFLNHCGGAREDLHAIPGLVFRQAGKIRVNAPSIVKNLDSLPMPAWDIIKPESYPEAPHGAFTKQFPVAPMIITRGCTYSCTFCAGKSISGSSIRKRSVDNVMEEIIYLRRRGIQEIHIEDENFTAHKPLVMEFCERLLRDNIKISWSLPSGVRIDGLDKEMLSLMERAGCYSLALGIEFGTQRMLDAAKKRLALETIEKKMALLKRGNIKTTGFFMIGMPGETIDEMKQTIRFALRLPLDRAQFNNFMPLPGSELWERLCRDGNIRSIAWNRLFVHDVAYTDAGVAPSKIKRLQRYAYLRFYLRPKIIKNLLKEIRSIRHLKFLLKRLWDGIS